jgi:hypothetical protein
LAQLGKHTGPVLVHSAAQLSLVQTCTAWGHDHSGQCASWHGAGMLHAHAASTIARLAARSRWPTDNHESSKGQRHMEQRPGMVARLHMA